MENKKILMVEMADPFATGGGSFASYAHVKAISDIFGGNVDVCIADSCRKENFDFVVNKVFRVPQRSIVSRILSIFTGELHRYTSFVKKLLLNQKYDICVYDQGRVSGSLSFFSKKMNKKVITFHHNYEPEYIWDNSNIILRFLIINWVKKLEKNAYKLSDVNFFLTQYDMDKFLKKYGKSSGKNFVIGNYEINERDTISYNSNLPEKKTITITGSLCDRQTKDGIKYFFDELYDCIPQDWIIDIAGRNPSLEIRTLCSRHKNVQLIENPPSMTEVLKKSSLYLCPTKFGGGLKLRIMDGLRAGIPVIAHEASARGYDVFFNEPYFEQFKTKETFKSALAKIICRIESGTINSDTIQESYDKIFSYSAGVNRLKNAFLETGLIE